MPQHGHTNAPHPMAESVTQNCKSARLEVNSETLIPLVQTDVLLPSHRYISANVFKHIRPIAAPWAESCTQSIAMSTRKIWEFHFDEPTTWKTTNRPYDDRTGG